MSDNTPKTADTRSPIMNDSTPSIPVSPVDTTTSDSTTSTTVSQNSTITNEKVSSTTILPPSEANETLDAEVKKVDSDNKKEGTSGPEEIPVPTTMIDKVALIIEPAAKEGHETPHSGVNESDIEETQEITNTSEEKLVPKPIPENAALIVEPAAKISDKFLDPKVYEINIDDTQESTNRAVKTPSASIKEKKVTFTEAPSNIAKERIDSHVEASHVSEPLDFEAHENDVIERQQKKRQPGKSHVCNPITQERSPQSRTASSDTCDSEATYVADVTEQEAEQYYKPPFSPPKADNIATNVNSEMNKSRSNNVEQLKVPEGRASDTGKALGLITFVDELKRSTWETDRELKSEIEGLAKILWPSGILEVVIKLKESDPKRHTAIIHNPKIDHVYATSNKMILNSREKTISALLREMRRLVEQKQVVANKRRVETASNAKKNPAGSDDGWGRKASKFVRRHVTK